MIGFTGPKFRPGDPEQEQPIWRAYHGTEVKGNCIFDREWDNENFSQETSTDRFQLAASGAFCSVRGSEKLIVFRYSRT